MPDNGTGGNPQSGWKQLGLAGVLGGIVTYAGTQVPTLVQYLQHRADQAQQFDENERAFILRIIELQKSGDAAQGQNVAVLTSLVAKHYLKDPFATEFITAIADLGFKPGAPPTPSSPEAVAGQAPAAQTASALAKRENAIKVVDALASQGAQQDIPKSVKDVLAPQIYFQIGEPGDRQTAAQIRGRLQQDLGQDWRIQGDELVSSFRGATQLRYFYPEDRDAAERVAQNLAQYFDGVKCQRIAGYDTSGKVNPRVFEVWLAPGARANEAPANRATAQKICS